MSKSQNPLKIIHTPPKAAIHPYSFSLPLGIINSKIQIVENIFDGVI